MRTWLLALLMPASASLHAEAKDDTRLQTRYGAADSGALTDFAWRDGKMVEVAAAPAACPSSMANASGAARTRKVTGQGRLHFLNAPRPDCAQAGVFVIPGDVVQACQHEGDYTFVHYVNPKTGRSVQGWVSSSRLAGAEAP